MEAYTLVAPSLALKDAYLDFAADWATQEAPIIPYSARLLGMTYEEWLAMTVDIETKAPQGFVEAHTYFLVDAEGTILGAINIRHRLNEYLLNYGGHIGYGIRPSARRQGHAARMLAMALPLTKALGVDRALVCCLKANEGSARTIQRNGGVLENEVFEGDRLVQRYWIDLGG